MKKEEILEKYCSNCGLENSECQCDIEVFELSNSLNDICEQEANESAMD